MGIFTSEYAGVTPYTGGVGVHYAALAPELVRRGHEVRVFVVAPGAGGEHRREGVHIERVSPGPSGTPWRITPVVQATMLASALRRRRGELDVLFGPEWLGLGAVAAMSARRPPLVTNLATSLAQIEAIEGPKEHSGAEVARRALQRRLERSQTVRSEGVIACSTAILRWARELWPLDGVRAQAALPNFIDVERTRRLAAGAPPDGFPQDGPAIVFAGRLETRKGVHVLADAMPAVWARHPQTRLVMVGGDSESDGRSVADAIRDKLELHRERVHVLGAHPLERALPAVARADVVALPSLWENFSIAALEARALARPVVATSGSGFDDFFTDGRDGLLVAPGDQDALAKALVRLLDDAELRRRLGQAAAADMQRYTAAEGVDAYVDLLLRTIAAGRTPAPRGRRRVRRPTRGA